jgi:hypothetical protein
MGEGNRAALETTGMMWPWKKETKAINAPRRAPPATAHCVACHAVYGRAAPEVCPRCGADNRAWYAWQQAGWPPQLKHFFLQTPWGWLALFSLLLPLCGGGFFALTPRLVQAAILTLSLLLSLGSLLFVYLEREDLWLQELMHRSALRQEGVQRVWQMSLLVQGGIGFLFFILAGGGLLGVLLGGQTALGPGGLAGWVALLASGLAFAAQTWAAGIYALLAYGRWRLRAFPPPIFVREAQLLALVAAEARLRLQLKLRQPEKLSLQVVSVARTARAEITLQIQASWSTEEAARGYFLRAVQPWQVVSNIWGHVKQLAPAGPFEYTPDLARPYSSPETPPVEQVANSLYESEPPPAVGQVANLLDESEPPPAEGSPMEQVDNLPGAETPEPAVEQVANLLDESEPPAQPANPALEGELIFDEAAAPARIEDAIILAVVASSYRRQRDG